MRGRPVARRFGVGKGVFGDLGVGGEPHPLPRGDVIDELGEDCHPGAVADDVRMHRQLKQPPVGAGAPSNSSIQMVSSLRGLAYGRSAP